VLGLEGPGLFVLLGEEELGARVIVDENGMLLPTELGVKGVLPAIAEVTDELEVVVLPRVAEEVKTRLLEVKSVEGVA
jgi:hypothetical protein